MPTSSPEIIVQLNAVLRHMLTGINQFFLHARVLKHKGELKLADYTYKTSIDAMKFSDMLVEHVLQLGGMPNMQDLERLNIGASPVQMLANDCGHAEAGLVLLRKAAEMASQKNTAELLNRIAENQQEHVHSLHALLETLAPQQPIKDCT